MKTLIEQIKEVVQAYQEIKDKDFEETVTVIRNKENHDDVLTDLNDAFTKQIDLTRYEKVTFVNSPKKDLLKMLGNVSYDDIRDVEIFLGILPQLIDVEAEFKKEKSTAFVRLMNAKKGKGKISVEEAQAKLLDVYTKYKKEYKPKKI
jgi:hypothetical protein